jgi:hypothetical protein
MNSLLSPLGKNYCVWFYYLSFINLLFMVLLIVGFIFTLFSKDKEVQKHTYPMIYSFFALFFTYMQSRLFYGMCINSFK